MDCHLETPSIPGRNHKPKQFFQHLFSQLDTKSVSQDVESFLQAFY